MFFEDLSHYSYYLPDNCKFENVLNVGWLDSDHPIPTGAVETGIITRLRELICCSNIDINVHVNQIRGLHPCNLCGEYPKLRCADGGIIDLGGSEIWIPSADSNIIFAAPEMVIHYIEKHSYSPPPEYIEAVQNLNDSQTFDGQRIYEQLASQLMKGRN